MSKELQANGIISALSDEFDIEDDSKVSLTVIEPTSIDEIKRADNSINSKVDVAEDYVIIRTTLQETLEQTKEILKSSAELIDQTQNTNLIGTVPDIVKCINLTAKSLFDVHVTIHKQQTKSKEASTGDKEEHTEGLTTKEFLNKQK